MAEKRIVDPFYGSTEGNIANMAEGSVDLCLSSPPFADTDTKPTKLGSGASTRATGDGAGRNKGDYHYGDTLGQLGAMSTGTPPPEVP